MWQSLNRTFSHVKREIQVVPFFACQILSWLSPRKASQREGVWLSLEMTPGGDVPSPLLQNQSAALLVALSARKFD